MAEHSVHDVVNQAQSMGDSSPVDVSGRTFTSNGAGAGNEGEGSGLETQDSNDNATPPTAVLPEKGASEVPDSDNTKTSTINGNDDSAQDHPDSAILSENVNGVDSASYTGSEDAQDPIDSRREGSGGSESRNEERGSQEGAWRRERSNSIAKKPAAFKSVSVTKNYLAKSGSAIPATIRSGTAHAALNSQSSSPVPQAAKPRLVAKLGKDARTSTLIPSGTTSGGPDASKVWNRNRPVPPPIPKQFTDEELKQQYGIHLATRLQADEAGKDGKWADIDDDEDDWAPEAVQWMDGTKSNLTPEVPTTSAATEQSSKPDVDAGAGTSSLNPQTTSVSGIGKTILRPGARLTSNNQTRPGLILRSVPESPAPASGQSSVSQSKSPWAPLPPVDKASPVAFVPPAYPPSHSPLSARRNSSAIEDAPNASPAKEIAADDFDRSWRENDRAGQALFNSTSGRYEPVKAVRRSSRNEPAGFRPPSVLQRPPHQNQPSEANGTPQVFTASRSWVRKAADAGSGAGGGGEESNVKNNDPAKPIDDHSSDPAQKDLPATHSGPPSSAVAPVDPRVQQQQLMRERLELNRKRKQEEADREAAALQERIKQRLAELETKSTTAKAPGKSPTTAHLAADNNNSTTTTAAATTESPSSQTRPDVPSTASIATKSETQSNPVHPGSASISPSVQALSKSTGDLKSAHFKADETQQLPGLGQPVQHWNRMSHHSEGQGQWTNRHGQGHNGNVWGPPSNDRPIGNGAFDNQMNRLASGQMVPVNAVPASARSMNMSPAISLGSPHPTPSPPHFDENVSRHQTTFGPPSVGPSHQRFMNQEPSRKSAHDITAAKQAWANFSSTVDEHDRLVDQDRLDKANMAMMQHLEEKRSRGITQPEKAEIGETFRKIVVGDVLGQRKKSPLELVHETAAKGSIGDQGVIAPPHQQSMQPASLHPVGNGRSSRFFGPGVERGQLSPAYRFSDTSPMSARSTSPPPPDTVEHKVYGGRFHAMVKLPQPHPTVKFPPTHLTTPSGTQQAGPVSMPPRPASANPTSQTNWQAQFDRLFSRPSAPVNAQQTAQSPIVPPKIANQLTRTSAQPAAPIASSSKVSLDELGPSNAATVSLPAGPGQVGKSRALTNAPAGSNIFTKPTEEKLMEDREFGSSPTVKVFKGTHPRESDILGPTPPKPRQLNNAQREELSNGLVFVSAEDISLTETLAANHFVISINMLGHQPTTKTLKRHGQRASSYKHGFDHSTKGKRGGTITKKRNTNSLSGKAPSNPNVAKTRAAQQNITGEGTTKSPSTNKRTGPHGSAPGAKRQASGGPASAPHQKFQKKAATRAASAPQAA